MCRNIIRNTNHEVVVFDLNPAALKECTDLGASAGASVADVASRCEVVITSLPMPRHVEAVAAEIGANSKPGTVYIDLSTNSVDCAQRVHAALDQKGIRMLEAPVSGGVAGATAGTIAIMVGGDERLFEEQRPLFASFGKSVIHVGAVGMGSVAKLVNNMLAFCNAAAAAEALMLGKMAGIDMHKLHQVISNSSGNSFGFGNLAAKAFAGDYKASFALDLAHKDLRLALQLADSVGMPGLIAPQVMNLHRIAQSKGWGGDDSASIMRVYEEALGQTVRT